MQSSRRVWRASTRVAALVTATLVTVAACGGGGDDKKAAPSRSTDTTEAESSKTVAAAAIAGVEDVLPDPKLDLADDVVVVRSNGGKAVKEFADDGETIVIAADAKGASELEQGDILLLTGVTVVRVAQLETDGDELRITGAPVTLPEVVENGELSWSNKSIDMANARLVGWAEASASGGDGSSSGEDSDPAADGEIDEQETEEMWGDVNDALSGESHVDLGDTKPISHVVAAPVGQTKAPEPFSIKGKMPVGSDSFDFEFSYSVEANKPHMVMQVEFGDDLKGTVKVDVALEKLATSGTASVADRRVDNFEFGLDDLSGEVTLEADVNALEQVASLVTKPFLELPFGFEVPIVIGGLPLTFSGESTIQVNLSMALPGSTMGGKAVIQFGGPAGIKVKDAALTVFGKQISEAPNLLETVKGAVKGPVGMVYTTELPRVGLGFGFGKLASSKVFLSNGVVVSFTLLPMPAPCTASNIAHVVAVGMDADFLGLEVELGRKAISDQRWNYQVPNDQRCNAPR